MTKEVTLEEILAYERQRFQEEAGAPGLSVEEVSGASIGTNSGLNRETDPAARTPLGVREDGTLVEDGESVQSGTEGSSSAGLTVAEIKAALDAKGIAYPSTAKKAELQKLLDEAGE